MLIFTFLQNSRFAFRSIPDTPLLISQTSKSINLLLFFLFLQIFILEIEHFSLFYQDLNLLLKRFPLSLLPLQDPDNFIHSLFCLFFSLQASRPHFFFDFCLRSDKTVLDISQLLLQGTGGVQFTANPGDLNQGLPQSIKIFVDTRFEGFLAIRWLMIELADLLHQELLELAKVREGTRYIVCPRHVCKESFIDLSIILSFDSFQLVVHLLIKIIKTNQTKRFFKGLLWSLEMEQENIIMNGQDDFYEVNNEVPFKPIKIIKIESLTLNEDNIKVRASMTLQDQSEVDFVQLNRTEKDVLWLLENLTNSGRTPLLPSINCENTLSHLISLISGTQPVKVKKLKLLKEKVLLRCLTLISTICLDHLKQIGEQYVIPIFIFFHENFSLYQNPIYYKEQKVALSAKVGNYFWHKYALFTGKAHWQQLQNIKGQLTQQRARLNQVTSKLCDYLSQLAKLQEQFISEKQCIKKRTTRTQELYLSFEMQLRYLDMVIEEANETAVRAEQQKIENQHLIASYGELLKKQMQEAAKINQKLLGEYVKVICEEEDKLRIAPH